MMKYKVGKWYGWNGGECPVHPETVVMLISKGSVVNEIKAGWDDWHHTHGDENIVAFRIIKEYKEPREWWIKDGIAHQVAPPQSAHVCYIHVREVLQND